MSIPFSFKMTPSPLSERRQRHTEAFQLLSSAIKHEKDLTALASLDDDQLLDFLNQKLKASGRKKAVKAARELAAALTRFANVLLGQDTNAILSLAKTDSLTARQREIENKTLIPAGEITLKLGISRQALNKAVQAQRIFFVEVGGINYYPAFYCDLNLERRQLEKISKALGNLLGWQKWQFFTTPKASLVGLTPLASLKNGHLDNVLNAAYGFAER